MPRAPDERVSRAKDLFDKGMKLVEIAKMLSVSEGTVRSWKSRYKWDNATLQKKKRNVAKHKEVKKEAVAEEVMQVLENPELTDKQRLFCLYYVRCFNATKAYQKAYGCSYEVAASIAYRMMENDGIKSEILRLKQNRLNRDFLSEEDIFQKYMDIAFADITDYVSFGREKVPVMGAFGPVQVKNEETGKKEPLMKEINTVRFAESTEVDGSLISEVKQGKDGASIKLLDKMKALQWLSDHMEMATEEQKARIDNIKANTERINRDGNQEKEDGVEIINDAP